jgi:multiple sugar transport system permease protein
VILLAWGVFALFPLYWMLVTAFKRNKDIYSNDAPLYIPGVDFSPKLDSWRYLFGAGREQFLLGFRNSVLFATISALFAVAIGALAAYGLARYRYKYGPMRNDNLSFLIVSQRMMPPIVAIIALFAVFRWAGLLDSRLGMIIIYTWYNLPLAVFLLTDFMQRVPVEVEQAAAVDGYGRLARIWKVTVPLAVPGLAAAYLLCFFFAWNDFLLALMLTFRESMTLPVVITSFSDQLEPRWWLLSAVGLLAMIPPALAITLLDRYMDRQVVHGGAQQ